MITIWKDDRKCGLDWQAVAALVNGPYPGSTLSGTKFNPLASGFYKLDDGTWLHLRPSSAGRHQRLYVLCCHREFAAGHYGMHIQSRLHLARGRRPHNAHKCRTCGTFEVCLGCYERAFLNECGDCYTARVER